MRMVYNVIDQILAEIPEGYDSNLVNDLKRVRDKTLYKAPEQMPEYFKTVSVMLAHYLGEPDTEWKKKIVRIFADKE